MIEDVQRLDVRVKCPWLLRPLTAAQLPSNLGKAEMGRWLEYDLVALLALVLGIAAIELLAVGF
jgi:hypothetical protein